MTEMMAFERLEPFGALHQELMLGQVCAVIANVHRDSKRRSDPFAPQDFMPGLRKALGQGTDAILLDDPRPSRSFS
jgi:hypothetical protein